MGSIDRYAGRPEVNIDLIQRNQYLFDLCQLVFGNELILSKIFFNLSLRELSISCQVCHKWRTEAKRVMAKRSQSLRIYHLFRTQDRTQEVWPNGEQSNRTDEELDYCMSWTDKYDFESNITKSLANNLQSIPEICLIVYGSFGEDVRLKQRLCQTEIVRKSLPVWTKCQIINLNSQCLIGFPTTSSVPIEKISHFGDLAAVSLFLLPKYRSGVDMTVFNGSDMREKLLRVSDIKAIVIFTTSSIFQDNRNLFLNINTLSRLIHQKNDRGIAFGGYNSAYFSFNKKDSLNYLDTDSETRLPANSETPLEAHELIGLCFSGPEVKACSIALNTKRINKTQQKLRQFKNNLGFSPLNNDLYETFAFMFTDEEKSDAFIKLNIFRNLFLGCQVLGISGYGQYGLDHWPAMNSPMTGPGSGLKSNTLKSFKSKKYKNRVKKRIALNTNMTTFVVIHLKKKLI